MDKKAAALGRLFVDSRFASGIRRSGRWFVTSHTSPTLIIKAAHELLLGTIHDQSGIIPMEVEGQP